MGLRILQIQPKMVTTSQQHISPRRLLPDPTRSTPVPYITRKLIIPQLSLYVEHLWCHCDSLPEQDSMGVQTIESHLEEFYRSALLCDSVEYKSRTDLQILSHLFPRLIRLVVWQAPIENSVVAHAIKPTGCIRGQKIIELTRRFSEKPNFEVTLRDEVSGGA